MRPPAGTRHARRWIGAAAVVALALRAAFGLFYWVDKPLTHDEREYLALARSLTEGRGFAYDPSEHTGTGQQFGRAPGYPAFLALIGGGRGRVDSSPDGVKIAQAVVGAATVWLIGLIALGAAGPRAGIAAAAIAAVYPPLVWIPAYVFSETLYSAVALLTAHTLQRAVAARSVPERGEHRFGGRELISLVASAFRRKDAPAARLPPEGEGHATIFPRLFRAPTRKATTLAMAAGALAGLAILIRPAMLFFLPLAVIWLMSRRQALLALALAAATVAVLAPWTARNARVHGRFVLVASEGGVTFWTGNHPLARGEGDLAANPELKLAELEFRRAHPGLSSEELEPLYYRDAFHSIAEAPGRWLALLARKLVYTVVPIGPSYTLHSTRYWAASIVSYLLVLPVAVAGLAAMRGAERRPTAVLVLGVSAVLVGLVFFPQERFRIPVIDPVLIIAAAMAIAGLTRDRRQLA